MSATKTQPTTALAPTNGGAKVRSASNSVIVRMAQQFQVDEVAFERTIKATCFQNGGRDVSNEQFAAFLLVAEDYRLNPLLKEIHAFTGRGGGVVPIVGVDGWVRLVNRQDDFRGFQQRVVHDEQLGVGVETTMYRENWRVPAVVTEWLNECKRNTDPWKMELRMLGHKSYIQCARKAYGFGGIYDEDEAERLVEAQVVSTVLGKSADNLDNLTTQLAAENASHVEQPAKAVEPEPATTDGTQSDIKF